MAEPFDSIFSAVKWIAEIVAKGRAEDRARRQLAVEFIEGIATMLEGAIQTYKNGEPIEKCHAMAQQLDIYFEANLRPLYDARDPAEMAKVQELHQVFRESIRIIQELNEQPKFQLSEKASSPQGQDFILALFSVVGQLRGAAMGLRALV